jgi:5-methylcytosine-specific restriction endonuclease McrA
MTAEEVALLKCFQMPSGQTIAGRTSSIRNAFVAAITPIITPTAAEIKEVLNILGMRPPNLQCSYCGDAATEWDHLQPLVTHGLPTGYPSSIRNLVPACGKCNQSKGKTYWKSWMLSKAKRSPTSRLIKDIPERIKRLEAYERWADCRPLDVRKLADEQLWVRYDQLQQQLLRKMKTAQALASEIKKQIAASLFEQLSERAASPTLPAPVSR